jgi:subtilase family serine protease
MQSRFSLPLLLVLSILSTLDAQVVTRPKRVLITERIDSTRLHRLTGNTRPEANPANDAGAVPADLAMEHMLLQLKRASEQEQALQKRIDQMHDSASPNFHKWLTPAEFAASYGPAQADVDAVTGWLATEGFRVNGVYPNQMTIDFSGTAAQVVKSFHTEMHYLNVRGERHLANMSDPQIPAALAPAMVGVVSMHDFRPRGMRRQHPNFTFNDSFGAEHAVTPGDLATIYNLNPLYAAGITGKGQTIAVIEDADIFDPADFDTFRSTFGLSQYTGGNLVSVHPLAPGIGSNCSAPGTRNGDDSESTLDAEWATAAAPDATIQVAACANTRTTFGVYIALQNLVNSPNPPSVISISYGECEPFSGEAANTAFRLAYQQAVAQGISVFVSAGDEGAAACDSGASGATHGISVSGFASTPYNVAVGGTDFGDSYARSTDNYWNSTNSTNFASVLSYIPEIPWNDSCASSLLATSMGFTSSYGNDGLCGSSAARQSGLLTVTAGAGGPSGCATGSPDVSGVVGGTCQGYAKPAWQTGIAGIPNDGVRDLPDVSLFAGTGVWGHFYIMCYSNVRNGGAPCTGDPSTWGGAGGTSFSAPILAGVQALVNQKTGAAQGNPNYVYYKLAASSTCDSAAGDNAASACVFHNVTQGDIAVNCGGTANCFGAAAATGRRAGPSVNGALSSSTDQYTPAYGAGSGWNFATGLGSINATNLVNNWSSAQ